MLLRHTRLRGTAGKAKPLSTNTAARRRLVFGKKIRPNGRFDTFTPSFWGLKPQTPKPGIQRVLSFFRSNQALTAFLLAVYAVMVRCAAFISPPEFTETGEMAFFTDLVHQFLGEHPIVAAVIAAALAIVQGMMVNRMANIHRISPSNSYFPGLFSIYLCSVVPDFLRLSAPLMSTTFVLISVNQLLKTWNDQKTGPARIFNVGFWLAIAALFYMPAFWLAIAAFAGLGLIRGFDLRERAMMLCGLATPFLLAWTWFFWRDAGGWFWEKHFLSQQFGLVQFFDQPFSEKTAAKIAILAAAALVVVLNYGSFFTRKTIQVQKFIGALNWFLVIAAASFLLRPHFEVAHFYLCAPLLGLFMGIVFLNIKNQPIAEVLHLLMLFVLVFMAIWA